MESISKRPVYLNLLKIRLPIGGVISITHRVTGVILVLLLPIAIYLLHISLQSEAAFDKTVRLIGSLAGRIVVLAVVWMFAQHFFSGIRHLLMDIDVGVDREPARRSAWASVAASVVTLILVGLWIA
jgi:succinate dehydrogenase / fumarate reductase cytochrome b subunit